MGGCPSGPSSGGGFLDPDEPETPPTLPKDPCCRAIPWVEHRSRELLSPAVEPVARRIGIDAEESQAVMPCIQQDVDERSSHLPWRAERPGMESVREYGSSSMPEAVERSGDSNQQPLHSAGKRRAVLGLGDQVDVVRLEGELIESES